MALLESDKDQSPIIDTTGLVDPEQIDQELADPSLPVEYRSTLKVRRPFIDRYKRLITDAQLSQKLGSLLILNTKLHDVISDDAHAIYAYLTEEIPDTERGENVTSYRIQVLKRNFYKELDIPVPDAKKTYHPR